MQLGRRWRRLRIAVPLALLVMILMRLVWMQLRSYPIIPDGRALVSLEVVRATTEIACSTQPNGRVSGTHSETAWPALPEQRRLAAAYDWVASPAYVLLGIVGCQTDLLDEHRAIKLNQWLLVATVIMATLLTRFITSSWTVALIVAAMLFSRGRLLADIGTASTDAPIMLLVTAWVTCCAHFLRTGAAASLALAALTAAVAALFDRSLVALCLVMPVLLLGGFLYRRRLAGPVLRRLRGTNRRRRVLYSGSGTSAWPVEEGESVFGRFARSMRWLLGMEFPPVGPGGRFRLSYDRGTLFRTIEVPFLLWAYWRRRWLKLSLGWLAIGATSVLALGALQWALSGTVGLESLTFHSAQPQATAAGWLSVWQTWCEVLGERLDLHLATSLIIMVLCAVQSPAAGLSSFLECTWLALLAGLVLVGSAFLADAADLRLVQALISDGLPASLLNGLAQRPVLLWLEPVVLSLGVAGLYNLMKVLDTRIAERP